jgi:hypothetical protein
VRLDLYADRRQPGTVPAEEVPELATKLRARDPKAVKRWEALIGASIDGDADAIRDVLNVMDSDPGSFRDPIAAMTDLPRRLLVNRAVGDDGPGDDRGIARGILEDHSRRLAVELAGPSPTAIERLLAERAGLCWLDCYASDTTDIRNRSRDWMVISNKRRDSAHHRYVTALKALASVRKTPIVAMQFNVSAAGARTGVEPDRGESRGV